VYLYSKFKLEDVEIMKKRQSKKWLKNLIDKASMELAKEFTFRQWVRDHHNDFKAGVNNG